MFQRDQDEAPATPACSACGEPSYCVVWDHLLCATCLVAWHAAKQLHEGLPQTDPAEYARGEHPRPHSVATCRRCQEVLGARSAEMTKRTAAWVAQQRVELAKGAA